MTRTPEFLAHPPVLTIAGSDPSGGAGLQADLKTFHQHGCYGMAVVTLLTAQNTTSVDDVLMLDAAFVARQLDAVLRDIPPRAIKTGALGTAAIIRSVAAQLALAPGPPVVVDPVLVSTQGAALALDDAVAAYCEALLPLATVVTPNRAEAARLAGIEVCDLPTMHEAAWRIIAAGARAVLVKGGDLADASTPGESVDVFCAAGDLAATELHAPRIVTRHTHGTGCTLSAAIVCGLARDLPLLAAVREAKAYVTAALRAAPGYGRGNGAVGHWG